MSETPAQTPATNKANGESLSRPASASAARIKSEPSPNRLPSLRGPRDLTLGGIKKKTFAPNIPVRKDRVKTEVKDEAKPNVKPSRSKRDRSRDSRGRGRGRGFNRPDTIQSHGIFEMGPGGESTNRGRESSGSQAEPSKQMQKPTIKKESVDLAMEQMESESVMRRLEEGNTSLIADLQNDENLKPVTLPLRCVAPPARVKVEKKEGVPPPPSNHPSMTSHVFSHQDAPKMILLQIPDTLPGVPPDEDRPFVKTEPGVATAKEEAQKTSAKCTLDQLSEGRVGKLQVLKSGRCRLLLGDVRFDLKMGTPSSFLEEFASIRLPPDGSPESAKGHVTIMGNVDHKLVCIPDVQSLVQRT